MSEPAGRLTLAAYRLLGAAFRPVVPLLLRRRAVRGKEVSARLTERYGFATQERPAGDLVWVHAASVGEVNASIALVQRLAATGRPVLLTTATVTGAQTAAGKLPPGAQHQFAPQDIRPFVRRFLAHWRPTLAIFVESEIWPEMTTALHDAKIPIVVANARISSGSFARWRRLNPFARLVFGHIDLCLAQSPKNGHRFAELGTDPVVVTGNLKFDLPPPAANPGRLRDLELAVAGRRLFLAASTHPGEEEIVATAHRMVAPRHAGLLTIIVPRHPERGPAIRAMLAGEGYSVALRSAGDPILSGTEIYLADTLGELGLFFRLAPIAFMGGSLVPHGGQNPIEPIALGAAVIHGPHVGNFDEVFAELDRMGQADLVTDSRTLADMVLALLADEERLDRRREQGPATLAEFSGALMATWEALAPFLEASQSGKASAPSPGPR